MIVNTPTSTAAGSALPRQHPLDPAGTASASSPPSSAAPPPQHQTQPRLFSPPGPLTRPPVAPAPAGMLPPLELMRPPRMPFFIREIYKNGFLRRLPHNEKKSSALSKLMRSDRFWTVFSVHDDAHPFLELWSEPSEVAAGRPPQYVYPLAVCQHISPSIVPAGDSEWSFVVNFETVAIRFACNSRATMDEWVECLRHKLAEMGFLNAKGNLYSKVPAASGPAKVARNPMSPLPSPPPDAVANPDSAATSVSTAEVSGQDDTSRNRLSIVDASDETNQSFTTSIYLNQTPPRNRQADPAGAVVSALSPPSTSETTSVKPSEDSLSTSVTSRAYESISPQRTPSKTVIRSPEKRLPLPVTSSTTNGTTAASTTVATTTTVNSTSSVYLNKTSSPTRHVTVIPINSIKNSGAEGETETSKPHDNHHHPSEEGQLQMYHRRRSPSRRQREATNVTTGRTSRKEEAAAAAAAAARSPANLNDSSHFSSAATGAVHRRYSDNRKLVVDSGNKGFNIQQRIRKRSQRSSSLGPLLDEHASFLVAERSAASGSGGLASSANTNSLESIDSNPRQAVARNDHRGATAMARRTTASSSTTTGAIARTPLVLNPDLQISSQSASGLSCSPPRQQHPVDLLGHPHLPPALRSQHHPPPSYHPAPNLHPPHIPLQGLTCQLSLSFLGSGTGLAPLGSSTELQQRSSLREQQVLRLRQEIAHPSGVRLVLRRRDLHNSLALVELFGCVWVAGWKQREYPVLYNAFHVGDQVIEGGVLDLSTVNAVSLTYLHYLVALRLPFLGPLQLRPPQLSCLPPFLPVLAAIAKTSFSLS